MKPKYNTSQIDDILRNDKWESIDLNRTSIETFEIWKKDISENIKKPLRDRAISLFLKIKTAENKSEILLNPNTWDIQTLLENVPKELLHLKNFIIWDGTNQNLFDLQNSQDIKPTLWQKKIK
jgi:hypothetical protein